MLKYIMLTALVLFAGYGLVEAWPLIAGPSLTVASPSDNAAFPGGIVSISGKALRAADLTLDGAPLLHGQDGDFSGTLTFPRGGSILTFEARDRFDRKVTVVRSIFVP